MNLKFVIFIANYVESYKMAYKERTENAISMFLVGALSCQCRVSAAPKCAMDMMMLNMDHGCKYDGPSLQENPCICVYGMN